MSKVTVISKSDIFFTCTGEEQYSTEHMIPVHLLSHIVSGFSKITKADKSYILKAGDTALLTRNQLAKFIKMPDGDIEYKSITIFFTQDFLQNYYSQNKPELIKGDKQPLTILPKHPLWEGLFESVLSYYDLPGTLPEDLKEIKLTEAITILRKLDISADNILTDFAEPGKIDLADFMQKNYMFNIPVERFAYLTGRSLATFKRDFQKLFGTTPGKWLLHKRLQQAHFLIKVRQLKPSSAYLEVGFENFSHFSFAFKNMYGYNPSSL